MPSSSVGAIIGKGGQVLKDLQAEFGVRIYVEKALEMGSGLRTVVLKPLSASSGREKYNRLNKLFR